MKVHQLLAHHGIAENPFGQEDAQSDQVFKKHCLAATYHPAWDKIFGSADDPSTSVVFGEKGSGKTALRLQIVEQINRHNRARPDRQVFVIEYDDFNPFLDCFRDRLWGWNKRPQRTLENWRLWDHMDAMLSLGVTRLVDLILASSPKDEHEPGGFHPDRLAQLSRLERRDLLLLAAFYNRSFSMPKSVRWNLLRKKLRFSAMMAEWDRVLGFVASAGLVWFLATKCTWQQIKDSVWWIVLFLLVVWFPWLWRQGNLFWQAWNVARQVRVIDFHPNRLRQLLSRFPRRELADQPMPARERSDDRYELLNKFQSVLRTLGYHGIIVLVDRLDEPHLINGSTDRMRELLWPMLDNKFLKHPGIGFKLLLPVEVSYHLGREDKEFFERSRLDKQNLIRTLQWTGESLYDVANDRIRACAAEGAKPSFRDLFDESITDAELIATLDRLRVPRHLFKFIHRLLVDHCNRYTDDNPRWKIGRETLQSTLSLYLRDLTEFDRGLGTG